MASRAHARRLAARGHHRGPVYYMHRLAATLMRRELHRHNAAARERYRARIGWHAQWRMDEAEAARRKLEHELLAERTFLGIPFGPAPEPIGWFDRKLVARTFFEANPL